MKSTLSVLILSFYLVPRVQADIVGGETVLPNDPVRSSTAALYTPGRTGHGGSLCTASLISRDTAVTAAHCISPGGPAPVILFGRDLHSPDTVSRPVRGARVNPIWKEHAGKGMDQGDIAVIHFPGGLPTGYSPVKPLRDEKSLNPGTNVVLAGYGISDAKPKTGAGTLRKTTVSIAKPRRGKSEMILDQSHGSGACHGDSGGPAYIRSGKRMVLAGVTNRSHPARARDDCAHQVVYTKVSAYQPWIKKSEKELRTQRSGQTWRVRKTASAMKMGVGKRSQAHKKKRRKERPRFPRKNLRSARIPTP